jgi:uncharacterized membrane protein YkvA (DUF1232 family)
MKDNFSAILIVLAILYILSPIDLVPDVIPVVGWADDLVVGAGALALASGRK